MAKSFSAVIPFIHSLNVDDETQWLEVLNNDTDELTFKPLADCTPQELASSEVAVVANPDPNHLKKLPKLKWVQSLWAGVEKLIGALPQEIEISRLVDPMLAEAMTESVMTWVFNLHRNFHIYAKQQNQQIWRQLPYQLPNERTVGILGLGQLGKKAALTLKQFNFNVIGWNRTEKSIAGITTYQGQSGLNEVLCHSDIVVVLLPLTPQTHQLLDRNNLSKMKLDAAIINFARGHIIDTDALLGLLDEKQLSHAVLDVFEQEPLSQNSPLWQHPSITVLPHIAAPTHRGSAAQIVKRNIHDYLSTGEMNDLVERTQGY